MHERRKPQSDPVGDGGRRPRVDRRHPLAPRTRAGRLLGTQRGEVGPRCRRDPRRRGHWRHRDERRRRPDGTRCRLRDVFARDGGTRDRRALARIRQERRHAAPLVLPLQARRLRPGSRVQEGRDDTARHGHPPRRHHRALSADGLGRFRAAITHVRAEEFSDIRTYGAPDVVGEADDASARRPKRPSRARC